MSALRRSLGVCLVLIGLFAWTAPPAGALSAEPYTPPPVQAASPLLITGYGFDGTNVSYVQLFNKSDSVVDLADWQIQYRPSGGNDYGLLVGLDGLLRPSSYVLAAAASIIDGADYTFVLSEEGAGLSAASFRILPPAQYKPEEIKLPTKQETSFWRRNVSDTTGSYLSTFSAFVPAGSDVLYAGGLYDFPEEAGLQVSEILPNPKDCSPIDTALDCRDYVKFYNPTTQPIDLSAFRLRSGYQGQGATSSNTFLLSGVIQPGHYGAVTAAPDGRPLALTNSGGYVWLEDMYGVKLYEPTVQVYGDASSDSRKGHAWAYDDADGNWKWTSSPTPADMPSVFPPAVVVEAAVEATLAPCQPNQYRSPETNRCRLLPVSEVVTLAECAAGQYRNPLTNRCRHIEVASTLVPCGEGQERNPATNRCRLIAAAEPGLVPCKPGQERNPETNRCRSVSAPTDLADVPFPVDPAPQGSAGFTGWWALGGIVAAGAGYGVWEWREELLAAGRRAARYFPFVK